MTKRQINVNAKLRIHFFLLLAVGLASSFLSAPPVGQSGFAQWAVSALAFGFFTIFPLLFFIPTVLKPTARSLSWFGFFLLAYLVWAIVKMLSSNGFLAGLLLTVFNLSTFFYVVMWLRPLKKIAKAQQSSSRRE